MEVLFKPLTLESVATYMNVGTQSYKEHYLHLWKNQDPTSYLETSFTKEVVLNELQDANCHNYLLEFRGSYAGILKIVLDEGWGEWTAKEALYLHRIYLLRNCTGKSIGKAVLDFTLQLAKDHKKEIIWLEAMKKGNAKSFYQKHGYTIIGESNVELSGVLEEEKEMWVMAKRL